MRSYSTSKFRLLLLTLMLGAAVFTVGTSFGQAQTPAGGGATGAGGTTPAANGTATNTSLVRVILGNTDFVFFTIAALSITGVTLIIQGFIRNRAAVLMPEETTNRIREMMEAR